MIVCSCHAVSDSTLEREALTCGGNVRKVVGKTKASTDCGACTQDVKAICKKARRSIPLWPIGQRGVAA